MTTPQRVPRTYALGVLIERLYDDVVLERLDTYAARGQSPQEKAKIERRRERNARRNVKRYVKMIQGEWDAMRQADQGR